MPIYGASEDAFRFVGYRIRPHDKTVSKANLTQAVVPVGALKPKHWRTYAARVRIARCPINTTIAFQPYLGGAATGSVVQVRNYVGKHMKAGSRRRAPEYATHIFLFFAWTLFQSRVYPVTASRSCQRTKELKNPISFTR